MPYCMKNHQDRDEKDGIPETNRRSSSHANFETYYSLTQLNFLGLFPSLSVILFLRSRHSFHSKSYIFLQKSKDVGWAATPLERRLCFQAHPARGRFLSSSNDTWYPFDSIYPRLLDSRLTSPSISVSQNLQ